MSLTLPDFANGDAAALPSRAAAATLSNSEDLTAFARAMRFNDTGTVRVLFRDNADDAPVDLVVGAVGDVVPGVIRRVFATGTTIAAADIILFF